MIVGSVVLDEGGDRWDVAGVHGWNAGGAAHGGSLVVQVQHTDDNTQEEDKRGKRAHLIHNEAFASCHISHRTAEHFVSWNYLLTQTSER